MCGAARTGNGRCKRDDSWRLQEGQGEHARYRDAMKDAEEDIAVGKGEVGRNRNDERRASDLEEPVQERPPFEPARMRKSQPDPTRVRKDPAIASRTIARLGFRRCWWR